MAEDRVTSIEGARGSAIEVAAGVEVGDQARRHRQAQTTADRLRGIVVLRVAFERWVTGSGEESLAEEIKTLLGRLSAVTRP